MNTIICDWMPRHAAEADLVFKEMYDTTLAERFTPDKYQLMHIEMFPDHIIHAECLGGDIDLSAANDCMQQGLALLAEGKLLPSTDVLITPDTTNQINTLFTEFFADPSMTPEDAQAQFVRIIGNAE